MRVPYTHTDSKISFGRVSTLHIYIATGWRMRVAGYVWLSIDASKGVQCKAPNNFILMAPLKTAEEVRKISDE